MGWAHCRFVVGWGRRRHVGTGVVVFARDMAVVILGDHTALIVRSFGTSHGVVDLLWVADLRAVRGHGARLSAGRGAFEPGRCRQVRNGGGLGRRRRRRRGCRRRCVGAGVVVLPLDAAIVVRFHNVCGFSDAGWRRGGSVEGGVVVLHGLSATLATRLGVIVVRRGTAGSTVIGGPAIDAAQSRAVAGLDRSHGVIAAPVGQVRVQSEHSGVGVAIPTAVDPAVEHGHGLAVRVAFAA
mmetsp:Transcript_27354/g.74122  ORF Transcript_27354/g.74122 Transcript_27354/m.74122 type:complete len:239 (-) Transcript_27354:691-1407(-)